MEQKRFYGNHRFEEVHKRAQAFCFVDLGDIQDTHLSQINELKLGFSGFGPCKKWHTKLTTICGTEIFVPHIQ